MPPNEHREHLKKFYNDLAIQSIGPDNPFYYPFLQDADEDPIADLRQCISMSQSQSVNLFTGQRGSGKSTEFRRLQQMLNEEDDCEVFLLDMLNYMNMTTPVEISDFLISVMAALSEAVAERFKQSPAHRGYLERLNDVLKKDIVIGEVNVSITDALDIKASLKDDPTFKERLQTGLKGHVARIVKDAHGFAQEVVALIREKTGDNNRKIVILVDSVEQIRGVGTEANKIYDSVENMFSVHASSLQIPMLHIVYTIPPYLTPLAPGLGRQLGVNLCCTLPCIHVQTQNNQVDDNDLAIMRELLKKRCPDALQSFFNETQQNKLAQASGGDLREFFLLVRDSITKATARNTGVLTVPDDIIERTLNHARRAMLPIAENDKEWLIRINDSKDAKMKSIDELPTLARFFDNKLVLNYRNGEDWYDVHPLIRDEIRR